MACSTAAPWGSNTVDFGETNTVTFTGKPNERPSPNLSNLFCAQDEKVVNSTLQTVARMKGRMIVQKTLSLNVGVDLRGPDVGVTKHFLNRSNICAAHQ